MDEIDSSQTKRTTRTRRGATESPADSKKSNDDTKKKPRTTKAKDKGEKDNASVDDFNDTASTKSSKSSGSNMRSCKVVLRRETFDEYRDGEDGRAIAHSTRARRTSKLTEENLASHVASPKRTSRAGSVTSDLSEPVVPRTRSTRSASQNTPAPNTPAKEKTPARRSSRLISENEKAADSPARRKLRSNSVVSEDISPPPTRNRGTPARRNLRSNSVVSEDISPPPTRARGTPVKALKLSQIKTEALTPRRSSGRFNKNVIIDEKIDEETEEEVNKKKTVGKSSRRLIDSDSENETHEEISVEPVAEEAEDAKPVIDINGLVVDITSPRLAQSPRTVAKRRSYVLVATSTIVSPIETASHRIAQSPTGEPMEPMEQSMTDQLQIQNTPKPKSPKIVEQSKTPYTPKQSDSSVHSNQMETTTIDNETIQTPVPESNDEPADEIVAKENADVVGEAGEANEVSEINQADDIDIEPVQVVEQEIERSENEEVSNVVENSPRIQTDFESMDVSDQENNADEENSTQIKKILNERTPKLKSRRSFSAFNAMNVSALVDDPDNELGAQKSKESLRPRKSLPIVQIDESIVEETFIEEIVELPNKNNDKQFPESTEDLPDLLLEPELQPEAGGSKKTESVKPTAEEEKVPKAKTPMKKRLSRTSTRATSMNDSIDDSFGDISMNLRSEIDKIAEGLNTPEPNKNESAVLPTNDVSMETEVDNIIAESDTTVMSNAKSPSGENNRINISTDAVIPNVETVPSESNQAIIDQQVQKTSEIADISVVDSAQSEMNDQSETLTTITQDASVSKPKERKSVQISTPKMVKSQSDLKRIDTPYPDEKSILEASAKYSKSEEKKQKEKEKKAEARGKLIQLVELRNSWSKKSASMNTSLPIDIFGLEDPSKKDNVPPKQAVVARNNWSASNDLDESNVTETEEEIIPETQYMDESNVTGTGEEIIPESQEEEMSDDETDAKKNEFFDDEAEEDNDYESGDSMNSDEKREIEDNQIEERGEDLGSEDTDEEYIDEEECEEEDEDDDDDGFIVDDDEIEQLYTDDEEIDRDETVVQKPRRRSRIIAPSSSEDDNSNSINNEIVSIELQASVEVGVVTNTEAASVQVEVVVANTNDVELVEGSKFPTTYLSQEHENGANEANDEAINAESSVDVGTERNIETAETAQTEPNQLQQAEAEGTQAPIEDPGPSVELNDEGKSVDGDANVVEQTKQTVQSVPLTVDQAEETVQPSTTEPNESEPIQIDENASSHPESSYDVITKKLIKKKIQATSNRNSLSGIDRIKNDSQTKNKSRVSLGDLDPNKQATRPTPLEIQFKVKHVVLADSPIEIVAEPTVEAESTNQMNDSSGSIESRNSNAENMSVKSSQEENNNRKSKQGKKLKRQEAMTEAGSSSQSNALEENVTSTSAEVVDSGVTLRKQKRRFLEVDTDTDMDEIERPKLKLLKGIKTASGLFVEEPITPEKQNRFGFNVTPLTPVNQQFRSSRNKRKSIYLEEEDAQQLLLPRPQWQINTQFQNEQPRVKRARKLEMGSTEVIFQRAEPTKPRIQPELATFRHDRMYRPDIPRQTAREYIRQKQNRFRR